MLYPENDREGQLRAAGLRQGLQKLGWAVDTDVQIDIQWGAGDSSWIHSAASQLLRLAPDAIVANGDTGGKDDAANEQHDSRHLHRRQRPRSGWSGAKPPPSGRQLDRVLRL